MQTALPSHAPKGKKAAGHGTSKAGALVPTLRKGKSSFLTALGAASARKSGAGVDSLLAEALSAARKKSMAAKTAHPSAKGISVGTQEAGSDSKELVDLKAAQQKKKLSGPDAQAAAAQLLAAKSAAPAKTADVRKTEGTGEPGSVPPAAAPRAGQKHEAKLLVVDLRKKVDAKPVAHDSGAQNAVVQQLGDKEPGTQLPSRLAVLGDGAADGQGKPEAAPETPQASTRDALERLREMSGSELVRASTMVLKEGGGEIRLVLKPESLGSIRIRMNLVDNHIEGRIVVDSSAVKQVVDGSIDALMRALTAEGFQTGSLQVSVGGQNAHGERQAQEPPERVRQVVAKGFERNVPGVENLSVGDLLVNLFV